MIKVLVVDDEHLARRGVILRLKNRPGFQVIGECRNGSDALALLQHTQADLIFLDMQMPELNGLELLNRLGRDRKASIIFLTAFDSHAVAAFEHFATDYLLKPIDDARFDEALSRVTRLYELQSQEEQLQRLAEAASHRPLPQPLERLAIKTGNRIAFVRTNEIDWIEASGDYAALHVGDKTHLLRESLSELAEQLDSFLFLRIHRSAIVQIDRIARLHTLANGDGRVTLLDGKVLRVSRTFSDALRRLLRNSDHRTVRSRGASQKTR